MEKKLIIKKEQTKENFDYSKVNKEIADIMKDAEKIMFIAKENTKYVFGEQLSKVQEQLVGDNQYNGFFEKWYEALNLKKDFVYNCINYYEMLVANPDDQKIQTLSFSKVCEVARLKENSELQKKVIDKAPLEKMKVKQIEKLVTVVKAKEELTEEMIQEIMQGDNNSNSSFKNFVKFTELLIKDLEKSEDIPKKDIEKIWNLIEKVKTVCPFTQKNQIISEEV